MVRTVILSNFTVIGDAECSIDPNEIFTVSGYTYNGDIIDLGTVTWGQLTNNYSIEVTDDALVEIKVTRNIVSTNPQSKTIKVNLCNTSKDDSVGEDCFCFTFIADVDDPHVYIGLFEDDEEYDALVYWGDNENSEMITGNHNVNHKYKGVSAGTAVTVAICGLCTRLKLIKDPITNGGMWVAPRLLFGVDDTFTADRNIGATCPRLRVVAINQWGKTEMRTFQSFADECGTLVSIPGGPIPHPTGAISNPETCFEKTFSKCGLLSSMSSCNNLFSNFPEVTHYTNTFYKCHNMKELPFDIFYGCTSAYSFHSTFEECYNVQISRYVGGLYYEDRIYHNGDANYPSSATTIEHFVFSDLYLKCSGKNAFAVPYWLYYPTDDSLDRKGCYYDVLFSNYITTPTSSAAIDNQYRRETISEEYFKNSIWS